MTLSLPTIEDFRQKVYPNLIAKGIDPPQQNSPAENQAFARWLKGWLKLNQKNIGHGRN